MRDSEILVPGAPRSLGIYLVVPSRCLDLGLSRSLPCPVRRDEDGSGLPTCCNRDPSVPHATLGSYGQEGTPACRLGDVMVTLVTTVTWRVPAQRT